MAERRPHGVAYRRSHRMAFRGAHTFKVRQRLVGFSRRPRDRPIPTYVGKVNSLRRHSERGWRDQRHDKGQGHQPNEDATCPSHYVAKELVPELANEAVVIQKQQHDHHQRWQQ